MYTCVIETVIALLCMRPQESLSLHSEGLARIRESFVVHAPSHFVLMVVCMFVTIG